MKDQLYQYLLLLGDNAMILGHRLSEWCGHGPSLETDIALTNISLDLWGQTRSYFQYAAEVKSGTNKEDDIAFLRYPNEYKNVLLVEQPNEDFGNTIARSFFFDTYHLLLLQQLTESSDTQIAAIATKSLKEVQYHQRFSSHWMKRLGDGTEESRQKLQTAVDHLWPYLGELKEETTVEEKMKKTGVGADLAQLSEPLEQMIYEVLKEATLSIPEIPQHQTGGKQGYHSEHMGFILTELQYMQRTYPNMEW
ncbi:MAG: 1,2-phenylacetyl-CoA epoxidase subunit PaaC [Cyclobacteriaceae bacterium]